MAQHPETIWLFPFVVMSIALICLAQVVGATFGMSPWSMLSGYGYKVLRMLPTVLCAAVIVQLGLSVRESPSAPAAAFLKRCRSIWSDPWLAAARAAPLVLMPFVFVAFSSLKMLMPRIIPFWLDDNLAAADRVLFLGHQPWELTHALFGAVGATYFIDKLYTFWVVLLSIAIVTVALFARRPDRARFFISFTLTWILLGVVGALVGASAGPCYSQLIGATSAPQFAGLMARLHSMATVTGGGIDALHWQAVLWQSYSHRIYAFGMGISAMPSLHNAIVTLYAFAAFRIGRLFGWFMTAYAILIFIGSIHLGWHYAVDGIFGAVGAAAIWWWVDKWCERSGYDEAVASGGTAPGIARA
jgi:hypothetical protein